MFNFFKKSEPESPKTLSAWEQIIEVVKSDPKVSDLEATHYGITCQYQDLKLVITDDNYITFEASEGTRFGMYDISSTGDTIVAGLRQNWTNMVTFDLDTLMTKIDKNYEKAKSCLMVHAELAGHEGYLGSLDGKPVFRTNTPDSICVTDTHIYCEYNLATNNDSVLNPGSINHVKIPGNMPYQCSVQRHLGNAFVKVGLEDVPYDYSQFVSQVLSDLTTYKRALINYGQDFGQVLFDNYTRDTQVRDGITYTVYREAKPTATTTTAPDAQLTLLVPTTMDPLLLEVRHPHSFKEYRDIQFLNKNRIIHMADSEERDYGTISIQCETVHQLAEYRDQLRALTMNVVKPNSLLDAIPLDANATIAPTEVEKPQGSPLQAAVKLDLSDLDQNQLKQ